MSSIITLQSTGDIASCHDSEILVRALKLCASDILKNLSRMAAILRRLDELGVKVEIEHALLPYVRMIANGSLTAECFLACSGDPKLLELATGLSPELQKRVAANEPFKLLEQNGKARMVGALDMTQREIKQVFRGCDVRSEQEQRQFVERQTTKRDLIKPDRQGTLPGSPGNFSKPGGRCPGCGARLLEGAECLKCNLESPQRVALAKLAERDYEEYAAMGRSNPDLGTGEDEENDGTLTEGWKDRMADLRQVKEHGNELGFHVDWLLTFLESWDGEDGSQTLSALLEKLSARFGYELTEAAA